MCKVKGHAQDQDHAKVRRKDKLNGNEVDVTVTSPPAGRSSDIFFSKFGRVASSS